MKRVLFFAIPVGAALSLAALGAVLLSDDSSGQGGLVYESSYLPIRTWEGLAFGTEALITFRVESIDQPRWNSRDGEAWGGEKTSNGSIGPRLYTLVHGEVTASHRGPIPLGSLTLRVHGDATQRREGNGLPSEQHLSGGFNTDASYVLALAERTFENQSGPSLHWTLAGNYQTNWEIRGGSAYGADRAWTAPTDVVISRMSTEMDARDRRPEGWRPDEF